MTTIKNDHHESFVAQNTVYPDVSLNELDLTLAKAPK